jgi:D-3-phosphoglycerate dehydrogenase
LRWIQSSAAGIDHCLVPEVVDSDVIVTGCSGLFRDSVAEQTMALLYGLVRNLPQFFRQQVRHQFTRRPTDDLHGLPIGIAGFGGNGQRIAELLRPVAGRIVATDRLADQWRETANFPQVDALLAADGLDEMLAQSRVVIATAPLDASTRGMFGARQFSMLPHGSWFINVGRGGLVDEAALLDALDRGRVRGAGLDVVMVEPLPADSPLWDHPRVIITPHVGAQSAARYQRVTELFCLNLERFQRGERLLNLVDKTIGVPLPADRAQFMRGP